MIFCRQFVLVMVILSVVLVSKAADFRCSEDGDVSILSGEAKVCGGFRMVFVKPGWKGYLQNQTTVESSDGRVTVKGRTEGGEATYALEIRKESDGTIGMKCAGNWPAEGNTIQCAYLDVNLPISLSQSSGTFQGGKGKSFTFPRKNAGKSPLFDGTVPFVSWDGDGQSGRIGFDPPTYVQLCDGRPWQDTRFKLMIFLPSSGAAVNLRIATKKISDSTAFVDRFGQCIKLTWPGKVTNEAELKKDADDEADWLKRFGDRPKHWDEYGGLEGTRETYGLKATGYFYTARAAERWVLVDPKGNIFFSVGVDLSTCDTITIVQDRRELFEWLPDPVPMFEGREGMSFYLLNVTRKYGDGDPAAWQKSTGRRLKAWGFNTLGCWSSTIPDVPFCLYLWGMISQSAPAMGGFPDVFATDFPSNLDEACRKSVAPNKDNPWLLGYYLSNEVSWDIVPEIVAGLDGSSAAKRRLVMLLEKRHGSVEAFNTAWGMSIKTFSDLLDQKLNAATPQARKDMETFLQLYCTTLGRQVRQAILKHDPNHILLGHRLLPRIASAEVIVRALSESSDVASINYYTSTPPDPGYLRRFYTAAGDKPVLLSEWSYGTDDRGHIGGVRNVSDQDERGRMYRAYVETAAVLPFVVGCEWFEYTDQASTGRPWGGVDAERYQTGLVDVVDRPYRTFLQYIAETNHRVYDVMMGKVKPFSLGSTGKAGNIGPVGISRRTKPVVMDGVLLPDWQGVPASVSLSGQNRVLGTPRAANELHADVWLQWDETYLYLAARVEDPTPMTNLHTESDTWNGDALELFLSARGRESGSLKEGDYQLGIHPGCPDRNIPPGIWNWTRRQAVQGATVVAKRRDANPPGYTLEAKIPFAALPGLSPAAGRQIGFDLALDHGGDQKNSPRTVQLIWHGSEGNAHNLGGWGVATFLP